MTCRLTAFLLLLNVSGILVPLFADDAPKRAVEVRHTERVSFAPGGTIQVLHSFGSLSVEGWDRPEVEVTVVKSAARGLERVRIVAEQHSDRVLTISTIARHKRFPYLWGGKGGVVVEYQVHAPRDSRLVIQHDAGYVLVSNMTEDVEATSHSGDILLMLPDSGKYSIDARSKLGTVSSDFAGNAHRRYLVGSGFASSTSSPSHRIYLRTRLGGITIKSVPAEAEAPIGAQDKAAITRLFQEVLQINMIAVTVLEPHSESVITAGTVDRCAGDLDAELSVGMRLWLRGIEYHSDGFQFEPLGSGDDPGLGT